MRARFDLTKAVFVLSFLDGVLSFLGNLALMINIAALVLSANVELACSAFFFIFFPTNAIGLILTAEVAVIR